jgi:hypothetical protein
LPALNPIESVRGDQTAITMGQNSEGP